MPKANAARTREVGGELDGKSLAAAVRVLFSLSWNQARDAIASGKISVDGAACADPVLRVRPGQVLSFCLTAPRRDALLDPIDAALVHVDRELVVVDKPSGISSVPFEEEHGTLKELVFRCLSRRERGRRAQGAGRESLAVVHRLDKETSGLLCFARTWAARASLKQQFREHSVHRLYLALVQGRVRRDAFTVRSHLLRDRGDGIRGSLERMTDPPRGAREAAKLAVTHVEVRERLAGATLCACRLETGRTHQIRIHLAESGHALLGERVYTRELSPGSARPRAPRGLIKAPRVMLHAAELGVVHPATGEALRFESPLPADLQALLESLRV
jgi:23S rRNA pseudouridine1911/1915/1917 synthase